MRWIVGVCLTFLIGVVSGQEAASIRLQAPGAPLYAQIGGTERKIADAAQKAWIVEGGREVVYSGLDGAGGYENEGQSLYAYTISTGEVRKIMAEFFVIQKVAVMKTAGGATALLVTMTDGGLGASHVAVVNLDRGEVFSADGAKFLENEGKMIVIGSYSDDDWEKLRKGMKVKPLQTKRYDADALMKRKVMDNKAGS